VAFHVPPALAQSASVFCGGHISRKGWTCEGKRERHCKNREQSFHSVFSLTLGHKV
jgi:hypothetical protein